MPLLTVIAGPNGSGKSTIVAQDPPPGEIVNTDQFARRLRPSRPEDASFEAGRQVLAHLAALLAAGADFNFETTLSSRQPLRLMADAKARGYRLELIFVVLRSRELNVARVRQRVARGGHDIPVEVVLRRYEKSFRNLLAALRLADQAIVYDNTGLELKTLLAVQGATLVSTTLDAANAFHAALAHAVAAAIDISPAALYAS